MGNGPSKTLPSSNVQNPINLAGQNSLSLLGTPFAPIFPPFLKNNPLPNGFPWGSLTSQNANPYQQMPDTGVTRSYSWTLTKEIAAPDGVDVPLILVNGQYPGPVIEANWGDWIEVTVSNNMTTQPAAIHWHGLLQKQTPWMDGVPGVDQCPIASGSSFTYKFRADLYGTTWYHSHVESQYASGGFGPMVIHGPDEQTKYDVDVGPIMVGEYYHEWWEDVLAGFLAKDPVLTRSDNNLINGKNSYLGNNAPLASFNFTSGKTMRLRFINPSPSAIEKISIDGHTMTVIANDFVPLKPYDTTVVTLAPGQRTDVLVKGNSKSKGSVWLRAFKPPNCSLSKEGSTLALAAIFYEGADRTLAPTSQAQSNAYDTYCGNDPLTKTVPLYPIAAGDPSVTEVLPIQLRSNGTSDIWYQAGRTMVVDYNDPILLDVKQGQLDFDPIRNVHNYGTNKSLRFIFENPGQQPHPIHMHGHNMFILQEGACTAAQASSGADQSGAVRQSSRHRREVEPRGLWPDWLWPFGGSGSSNSGSGGGKSSPATVKGHCWDGSIVNAQNPQRRDVQLLLPGHYLVVQWNQDNPGVWPLHCSSYRVARLGPVVKETSQIDLTRTTPLTESVPLIRVRVIADHVRETRVKVNPTNRYLKPGLILVRLPPPSAYMSKEVRKSGSVRAVSAFEREQGVEKSAYDGDEDTEESTGEISEEYHSEQENEQIVQDEVQEGVNSQDPSEVGVTGRWMEELMDKWRKWEDESVSVTINDEPLQAIRGRLKTMKAVTGALQDFRQTLRQFTDGADLPSSPRRERDPGVKAESRKEE